MKLYECPRNMGIKLESGEHLMFHHIDGMFSYCKDMQGNVVHLPAWADVEIDSWEEALDKLEEV